MIIGLAVGAILLVAGGLAAVSLRRKATLDARDENISLLGFLATYLGSWLVPAFALAWLNRTAALPRWVDAIVIGILFVATCLYQFLYWTSPPGQDRLQRRLSPEESIGGVGLGCFGIVVNLGVAGVFGLVLYALVR